MIVDKREEGLADNKANLEQTISLNPSMNPKNSTVNPLCDFSISRVRNTRTSHALEVPKGNLDDISTRCAAKGRVEITK